MSLGIIEEERLAALGYRIVTHSESDGQGEGQWFRAKANGAGVGLWRDSKTEAWADAAAHCKSKVKE